MTFQIEKLDKLIRTQMRRRNTPGLAISVLKSGQSVYSKGFGLRNLKQFKPMTTDTLMGVGSISKSFTAFAVMKLQEMGKLSIDDSVARYLAFEPFLSRPEITLKNLLSHSSGIPSLDAGKLGSSFAFNDFSNLYPATSRDDFLAHIADASDYIIFKPGEKFFYNNDMYSCLSFIVEKLTKMSFTDFVQQEVLYPLEMKRAVYTLQALNEDSDSNVMTGYRFQSVAGKSSAIESDLPIGGYYPPQGGLYVSINEMLNYAQCLLDAGAYNGGHLLSHESVGVLFEGIVPTPYGEGSNPKYALGWTIEQPTKKLPYTLIQHGGGLGTSSSFILLVPELKLAVVAAENASTGVAPLVVRSALALLLDQNPEEVVEVLQISKVLRELQGSYKTAHGLYDLNIELKAGVLQADIEIDDGRFSFSLTPIDLKNLDFAAYSLRLESKSRMQFYRNQETQRVEFVAYDRYLYQRA